MFFRHKSEFVRRIVTKIKHLRIRTVVISYLVFFCGLDITGCMCGFIGNEYEFLSWVLNIKDASLLK